MGGEKQAPPVHEQVRRLIDRIANNHQLSRQSENEAFRASAIIVLDTPMSARNRSSRSRSSLYCRRRAIPFKIASGSFQNHLRFGEGRWAATNVSAGPRALLQDMFHLRSGAKQRLARKLVGRLYVARTSYLSCATFAYKRSRRSADRDRLGAVQQRLLYTSAIKLLPWRRASPRSVKCPAVNPFGPECFS